MMMMMSPLSKRFLISAAAALAAGGALCASALASSSYTVKLKLPSNTIAPGHTFKVKATGVSPSSSRLTVFLSAKSCASNSKAEAGRSPTEIINKKVIHTYTGSKNAKAAGSTGTYYACAYLTRSSSTRAHATKKYFVVIGGY